MLSAQPRLIVLNMTIESSDRSSSRESTHIVACAKVDTRVNCGQLRIAETMTDYSEGEQQHRCSREYSIARDNVVLGDESCSGSEIEPSDLAAGNDRLW